MILIFFYNSVYRAVYCSHLTIKKYFIFHGSLKLISQLLLDYFLSTFLIKLIKYIKKNNFNSFYFLTYEILDKIKASLFSVYIYHFDDLSLLGPLLSVLLNPQNILFSFSMTSISLNEL